MKQKKIKTNPPNELSQGTLRSDVWDKLWMGPLGVSAPSLKLLPLKSPDCFSFTENNPSLRGPQRFQGRL